MLRAPELDNDAAYRRLFSDVSYWTPFVQEVAARHSLKAKEIRGGIAGSYPTFIVDDIWVVKFFGRLYNGAASFAAERAALSLLRDFPVPRLLAASTLLGTECVGWPWPYLMLSFVPGTALVETMRSVNEAEKIAHWAGELLHRLHSVPLPASGPLRASWDGYRALLERQYRRCQEQHRRWAALSPALIEEIPAYLPSLDRLISGAAPVLLHGDVTSDHILGLLGDCACGTGGWQPHALIDFGDALVGDPHYDLVTFHLDVFAGRRRLLSLFLEAYGWVPRLDFAHHMLALTLLFRFDALGPLFQRRPALRATSTLAELASLLWDVHAPS